MQQLATPHTPRWEQAELLRSSQSSAGHLHCGAAERRARLHRSAALGSTAHTMAELLQAPGRSPLSDLEQRQFALYKLWLLHCKMDTQGISVPGRKQDSANIESS